MSRNYDNWERLVDAVLKKEQLWQLFHAQSRSPSISSESSGFSFNLGLSSSADDVSFTFSVPYSDRNGGDDGIGGGAVESAAANPSRILIKDQSPAKKVTPTAPARKRDLRIQVPKPLNQHYGVSSPRMASPVQFSRLHPTAVEGTPGPEPPTNRPDGAKQESHPLPLPPEATPNSPQFFCPNSDVTSPTVPLPSPERAESHKSPWKRGKLLGKGAGGNVYLGFNSEKGKMCAMKEFISYSDCVKLEQSARCFRKEIALLSSLKHPNIVLYYGSEVVDDNLYCYYEYVSGGSLHMILQQYGKLGESAIRSYTQQILSGLAYLHSKSITHRDIRGATILVDPTGGVKLSRFGIEKQFAGQFSPSVLMDSPYWMAPEVIINPNTCNSAIDIWSLGCTVIEMATSKPPLSYDEGVALFKIANHRELPKIPDHLSDKGKDFLRHCLQWDPLRRATASQLLEHPFVKSSSPVAKQIGVSALLGQPLVTSASNSEGIDQVKDHHQLDLGTLASHPSRPSKSSDMYTPRNILTSASAVGSPLPYPRSSQNPNTQISPPPKPKPSTSTPMIVGNGAILYPHLNPPVLHPETFRNSPKHSPTIINTPSYWDPNILRGVHSAGASPSNNDSHRQKQLIRAGANELVNEQSALADRVFRQLVGTPMKSNSSLDWNPIKSPFTKNHLTGV